VAYLQEKNNTYIYHVLKKYAYNALYTGLHLILLHMQ